jgi:hypothetical protein
MLKYHLNSSRQLNKAHASLSCPRLVLLIRNDTRKPANFHDINGVDNKAADFA